MRRNLTRPPYALKINIPRKDGAGWERRKSVYDMDDTGIRKRRLPYVAHLFRPAFAELKRHHRAPSLERVIAERIEDRDKCSKAPQLHCLWLGVVSRTTAGSHCPAFF
jgi:hypothetical protein